MGLIIGLLFGALELFPFAHPQILSLIALPWIGQHFGFGLADNLMFIGAMLTTSLVCHTLTHTYHPIPKSLLAHAEAAQKLSYEGLGSLATAIQRDAIVVSLGLAALLTPILLYAKPLISLGLIPLTIGLAGLAVWKSKSKFLALIVLGIAVAVGTKAQSFGHEGMTPLLVGMFTLPPLLHLLMQGKAMEIPDEAQREAKNDRQLDPLDALLGAVAALLPGISASSMVHLKKEPDSTEAYLSSQAVQHNTAMFTAIFLLVAGGGPHSAVAVALFQTQGTLSAPIFSYLTILFGCVMALVPMLIFVAKAEPFYKLIAQYFPQKIFAMVFLPVSIWLSWHHAGIPGLFLMVAALGVSLMQKQANVPNQILLQALTIPMVAQMVLT